MTSRGMYYLYRSPLIAVTLKYEIYMRQYMIQKISSGSLSMCRGNDSQEAHTRAHILKRTTSVLYAVATENDLLVGRWFGISELRFSKPLDASYHCPTKNRGHSSGLLEMNNEPVGKKDIANVLSKYLKSVPNDNVFCVRAKQLHVWRGDFIVDMIYKNCREVEKNKKNKRITSRLSDGCPSVTIWAYFCFPVIDALTVWWHSFVCLC